MNIRRSRIIGIWLAVLLAVSLPEVQAFAESAEPEPTAQTTEATETEMVEEIVFLPADNAFETIIENEKEINDSNEKANDFQNDVTMCGTLTYGDKDIFRFQIHRKQVTGRFFIKSADKNLRVDIEHESGETQGYGIPVSQGSDGWYAFVIETGYSANGSYMHSALGAGTYYLRVTGGSKNEAVSYKIYMDFDDCRHTYTTETVVYPTCTEEGSIRYTCRDCQYSWEEAYGDALGHTPGSSTVTAPTCTQKGYILYRCANCTYFWQEYTADALGHVAGGNSVVTAPTCTQQGYTTFDCTRCGGTWKDQFVFALGHTEVIQAGIAATCTTNGLTEGKYCSVCNKVLTTQTVLPALGHTEIADPDVPPTCTGTGLKGIRCGTCGEVLQEAEVVPALGHTEVVAVPAVAPTCEKPGRTERIACSVCAEVLSPQKVVPALGHTVVADAYRAPTCSGTGLTKGSHCSVCGKVLQMQKSIPMVAHTEEIVPAVKPTCTTTGLTAGKRCSVCKAVLEQQTTVAVLEHRKVIDSPGVEATCTENGSTEGSHCSVCKTVIQKAQTIPAHHNYANGVCVSCGITSSRTWVWKYDEAAKTLFIFGTGAIPDYDGFDNKAPWYSLAVENVIIDEGITRIGNSAFLRNYRLSSVTLPASLTSIGNTAFHECYALSSITLPDSITSIGTHAFDLCTALTSVTLPAGLTTLEDGVFSRCSGLRSVTLPEGLTQIDIIAFCDCTGLEAITLPASVKKIDTYAFSGCSNLSKIIMEGSAPEIYEAFSGVTATVYYPANDPSWDTVIGRQWGGNLTWEKPEAASDGCGENLTWQYNGYTKMLTISGTGDMWNFTESNIPWKDYQRNIKTVMIADGVTGIGEYAFAACGNLCSITVPGSVTSIGDWAFTGCSALKEIIFLGDAPAIDGQAFHKVTATVIYPEGNAGWTAGVKQNYGGILTWGKNPKGDTNADGSVSGQDAVVLLWNVLFPEQYPMDGDVDYNRDAIIDAEDAVYLLWHTLFPELYPLD